MLRGILIQGKTYLRKMRNSKKPTFAQGVIGELD